MAGLVQRSSSAKPRVAWAAIVLAALSIFSLCRYFDPSASQKRRVELIPITTGAIGPESLAFGPDGEGPYTGVSDGRILKWQGNQWLEYAADYPPSLFEECKASGDTDRELLCGRPLGLRFHERTGKLYIADASFGLMAVSPGDRFAEPVATGAEGRPFMCANGVEVDQNNGLVYFTDSSLLFHRRDFMAAMVARDNTGRLMEYDPRTGEVQVLLRGLYYANGVQLSEDGSFLLVAETSSNRVLRYWLRPPKNGTVEVLVRLPGGPDNIKRSPRGGFWVAVHGTQPDRINLLWPLQNVLPLLFGGDGINVARRHKALAVRISEEGEVLETMEDLGSEMGRSISEVEERDGTLWIGNAVVPYVGVCRL